MAASDHSQFAFAAERYILNELPEQEQLAFEEHFFACASCAQEVEDLLAVRDGAIAALPQMDRPSAVEKRSWFSQLWVPQFAMAAFVLLGLFSAYQNVLIRHLRAETKDPLETLSSMQAVSSARSAKKPFAFSAADDLKPVVFPAEWSGSYDEYRATVSRYATTDVLSSRKVTIVDNAITVAVRPSRLSPGQYDLKILGIQKGGETKVVGHSPFSIN